MTEVRVKLCDNKCGCDKLIHKRARFSGCLKHKIPQYAT